MQRLLYLFAGCGAFWLLTALPGRMLGGDAVMATSSTALLLCFVPAALTLTWALWAMQHEPQQQLLVVIGGGGVRMFFVLSAGLLLIQLVPFYQERASAFLLWLLAAYLFTLALEIVLLVAGRGSPKGIQAKTMAANQPPPGPLS
jgi:hypothetical protein